MQHPLHRKGFGLIEVLVVIVVLGIISAVALQSVSDKIDDRRVTETSLEMETIADAIRGNPDRTVAQKRSDFGFVGDVGRFPVSLSELRQNLYGLSTWNGPYVGTPYDEDTSGYLHDEWGAPYTYSPGILLQSTGGKEPISYRIAESRADYLYNTFRGTILDADLLPPGPGYRDSVLVRIEVPDGAGGLTIAAVHPDSAGSFSIDSLPVGIHPVQIIFTPKSDTLKREYTLLPRHREAASYRFAEAHFASMPSTGGCGSAGVFVLRPDGDGDLNELTVAGASNNFEAVDETVADGEATRTSSPGSSFRVDLYSVEDPPGSSCTILKVTVFCRCRKSQSVGQVKAMLKLNGADFEGTERDLDAEYTVYSEDWSVNPLTGSVWQWEEIANLQAGIALKGQNASMPAYCTQVWVEVEYGS